MDTQNRPKSSHAKGKLRLSLTQFNRMLGKLEALFDAGQLCSNCCFNVAQRNPKADYVDALKLSYKTWDSAAQELRKALKP